MLNEKQRELIRNKRSEYDRLAKEFIIASQQASSDLEKQMLLNESWKNFGASSALFLILDDLEELSDPQP